MNIANTIRNFALFLGTDPRAYLAEKEYLFVISHMRSYSSLLGHILGSNPEIWGYAEFSLAYRRKVDLLKWRCKAYHGTGRAYAGRYLLDKVLHNRFELSDRLFSKNRPRLIFLLRDPEPAIKSILNMGTNISPDPRFNDAGKVTDYYCERLREMERYAGIWGQRSVFIRSEALVESPEPTLVKLTEFLELGLELDTSYSLFKHTGKPWYGDPSENIKSGRIVKKERQYDKILIPADCLERAESAHVQCLGSLQKYCHFPKLTN